MARQCWAAYHVGQPRRLQDQRELFPIQPRAAPPPPDADELYAKFVSLTIDDRGTGVSQPKATHELNTSWLFHPSGLHLADIAPFAAGMRAAVSPVESFVGSIKNAGTTLIGLTGIVAAVKGTAALGSIGEGIKLAADLEQSQVAFETMLGSAAAAKQVLGDSSRFAASTPFQLPDLVAASRQLLAFGISADTSQPTLELWGPAAVSAHQLGRSPRYSAG